MEAGAAGGEDVQEGVDGGGGVTQVQNKIRKVLGRKEGKKENITRDTKHWVLFQVNVHASLCVCACARLTCWLMVMAVGCLCEFSFIGSMAVAPSQ